MTKIHKLLISLIACFNKLWIWIKTNPKTSAVLPPLIYFFTNVVIPLTLDEIKDIYKSTPTQVSNRSIRTTPQITTKGKNISQFKLHQPRENPEIIVLKSIRLHQNIDSNPNLNNYSFEEEKNHLSEDSQAETIRTYCTPNMYLQITYENDGKKIVDYLVISKSKNFQPIIPGIEKSLGKYRFDEYNQTTGNLEFISFRSHFQGYFEEILPPSKSTNWVQVGLGFYHIGAQYRPPAFDWGPATVESKNLKRSLSSKIRNNFFPNAFLVSNGPRFFPQNEDNSTLPGRFPEWYTGADYSTFECLDIPKQE